MADAKKLERSYTIPLRREFLKVPKYKQAKKATAAIKQFLSKHMKSAEIKLSTKVNEEVWKHGMRNPPGKVRVTAVKDEKGVVSADLFGSKAAAKEKKAVKKESPKAKAAPVKEAPKAEEKKAEVKPAAEPVKVEVKEAPVATEAKE